MVRLWPLLLLVSCASLQAPRPEAKPAAHQGWDLPASLLVVPLQVPLHQVAPWGELTFGPTLDGQGAGQRTLAAWFLKHDWHYWWSYHLVRSPLSLGFVGEKFRVSAGLSGDLTAGWDTLPGEISTQVDARTGVETTLLVTPDWRLEGRTQTFLEVVRAEVPIGISWNGNFFGETISVADSVRTALAPALGTLEGQVGQWVSGVALRPAVDATWRGLQEPRSLGGSGLWFSLAPEGVAQGTIRASQDGVGVDLVVRARPTLTAGTRPPTTLQPLPRADRASTVDGRFDLHFPVTFEWTEASRISGKGLSLASGRVLVRSLTASPQGDRVLVRLDAGVTPPWSARVDAVLWLSGRPSWNPATRSLEVVDLELEASTKEYLAEAADWLLEPGWVTEVQGALVWNLGARLDELESLARTGLSSLALAPHVRLAAEVDGVDVIGVAVSVRGVELLTRLRSTASVDWVP